MRYTPLEPYVTIEDGMEAVEWCTNIFTEGTGIRWGIEDPSSGTVIGTCGYLNYEPGHQHRAGVRSSKALLGARQGIMTEVAEEVIDFGFRHLGVNRIEAKIIPDNEASGHLLIKLGFQYEGNLRQHEFEKGWFIDIAVYSIFVGRTAKWRRSIIDAYKYGKAVRGTALKQYYFRSRFRA